MNPIWCCVPGPNWFQAQADSILAPALTLQKTPTHSTHTTRRSRPQLQYHLCEGALHLCGLVLIFVEWWSCYHQLVGLCGSFEALKLREASCIYFDVLRAADMLDTY